MLRFRISRLIPIGVAFGLGLAGLAGYAIAANYVVSLTSGGPSPSTLTATLGDTVTFINNDSATHTVVDKGVGLKSPALAPGQSYPYVLTTSGRLSYRQEGKPAGNGVITVAKAGSVTLTASKGSIAYHSSSIALSGISSFPTAAVKIEQRTAADKKWVETTKLTPAADGSFSYTVTPETSTQFRANVFSGELLSKAVEVGVRPIITLTARRQRVPGGSFLLLRSRVVPADAATSIELIRYDSRRQEWHRVTTRGTKTGSVVFRWQVEFGRSALRAVVSKRALAKGYAAATTKTVVVIGTGKPPTRKHRKHP
jgi:plastocyanin